MADTPRQLFDKWNTKDREFDNFNDSLWEAYQMGWQNGSAHTWNLNGPPVVKDSKPLPIYTVPKENLYKISYKYVENSSENSLWKPTVEQLQALISKYGSVKTHPDNEDSLELCVFKWALTQCER